MIENKDLEILTIDELLLVISMCKNILKKTITVEKDFFSNLSNEETSYNKLYEDYILFCNDRNLKQKNKSDFNRLANLYINEFGIKIKKRVLEKKERIKKSGDVVSTIEE